MTPSKIADPLLPEQIAELRRKWQRVQELSDRAGYGEYADALAALENAAFDEDVFGRVLSAAERGIAAGEEVARLTTLLAATERDRRDIATHKDAIELHEAELEADLAASNARIGELEKEIARRDEADRVQRLRGPAEYGW